MPLSAVSQRQGALGSFTYRELLVHRRLALRAAARGRPNAAAMVARIEDELAMRRQRKLERQPGPRL